MTGRGEVLFIGGGAGVGKTSVAAELHAHLAAGRLRHALIEGDNLDLAWPVPWERGLHLAEANLATMWRTYQSAGYSRLIYTNTAAVRPDVIESLLAALGKDLVVHAVLLRARTQAVTRLAPSSAACESYRRSRPLDHTTLLCGWSVATGETWAS